MAAKQTARDYGANLALLVTLTATGNLLRSHGVTLWWCMLAAVAAGVVAWAAVRAAWRRPTAAQ